MTGLLDDEPAGALRRPMADARVVAVRRGRRLDLPERVATEEPLEIRVEGPGTEPAPVAVSMRTPGHDFELAVGFLLAEGVLTDPGAVRSVRYCVDVPDAAQRFNVVTVGCAEPPALGPARQVAVSSSCGLCGTATLDQLERRSAPLGPGPTVALDTLLALPDHLRRAQKVFDATGGLHAAGLFTAGGEALCVREDVGRHNAVDKLVGWAALEHRLPLSDAVLVVSGRVSFELVQKAATAGVAVLVAVSAPTSLAVSAARRLGITLAAFVRGGRANLYSEPGRVAPAA